MCVIIYRKPGIDIPFDKLVSACEVNADGMGIVVADRGQLHMRKVFNKKGNDPQELAKMLEDAKDHDVYVHLRYRTRGATDKDNVHPFGVLKKKKHGMDIQFMHNGTLTNYGNDRDCDSKDFVKKILTPISERFLKSMEPEGLLSDPVYQSLLKQYAGGSYFLLADNLGNHHIVNQSTGEQFNGWWASNKYSFNRYHRSPSTDYSSTRVWDSSTGKWRDADEDAGWSKMYGKHQGSSPKNEDEKKVISLPAVPGGTARTPQDPPFTPDKKEVAPKPAPLLSKRDTFVEIAGISTLSDVCELSYDQVQDLVEDYPDHAVVLIMDLLLELYGKGEETPDKDEDAPAEEEKVA